MDAVRKKELLVIAENLKIASDESSSSNFNFFSKFTNAVKIAKKNNDISDFYKAVKAFKTASFGGKTAKDGYIEFSENILQGESYEELEKLSLDELEFVFSWARRMKKGI